MPQVVIELPDEVLERAQALAEAAGISVDVYLSQRMSSWLTTYIPTLVDLDQVRFSALSDEMLLALIRSGPPDDVEGRHNDLTWGRLFGEVTQDEELEHARLRAEMELARILRSRASLTWRERHGTPPPQRGMPCCIDWPTPDGKPRDSSA